ncbi:hypothetical protein AGMMS50268_17920 [Spirochaetia bacterium]|nr:hypothetical protein AGMMS50268_17920 [Spirochaetia bacterium]
MSMKTKKYKFRTVLLAFAGLCIFSCDFSGLPSQEGIVTLYVDGKTNVSTMSHGSIVSRSIAYPPPSADLARLDFIIQLNGPGESRTVTFHGGDPVTLTLAPGRWNIQVDAWLEGAIYGEGDPLIVDITAGSSASASVTLRHPTRAWNEADFGASVTPDYMFFTASDPASGPGSLEYYLDGLDGSIDSNIDATGNYTVTVEGTQHTLLLASYSGTVNISLRGSGTINLSGGTGTMFSLGANAKLSLRGPKLVGSLSNSGGSVVQVDGELFMHAGEISGNDSGATATGGGVKVNGGNFTMTGGDIYGNTITGAGSHGGGVRNLGRDYFYHCCEFSYQL